MKISIPLGCLVLGITPFVSAGTGQNATADSSTAVSKAQAHTTYYTGNIPQEINGIKILFGTRGSKPFVPSSQIYNELSFAGDSSLAAGLKAGNVSSIKFTQHDVDLIAQTTPTGVFAFYSELPINMTGSLPSIINDVPKNFKSTCCNTSSSHSLGNLFSKNSHRRGEPLRLPSTSSEVVEATSEKSSELAPRAASYMYLENIPWNPLIDLFYHQPLSMYSKLEKGTAFAFRYIISNNFYFPAHTQASQVVYRTESTQHTPEADITTIFVPANNDNQHFITYQMHEDGDSLYCAYSYFYALGWIDKPLQVFLQHNWVVSIPDYEGPNSVFGAYERSGYSVLNSIKATIQMGSQLNYKNSYSFLYGYSAGATATGVAAEMVRSYAPELIGTIKGMAVGGYVNNLTATYFAINKAHFAGLIPMSLYSMANEYPDFKAVLDSSLTLRGQISLPLAAQGCSPTLYLFYGQDMFTLVKQGSAFVSIPTIASIMDRNGAGHSAPPFDVFIGQSVEDEVAPIATIDRTVNVYCQGGTHVSYLRNPTGEHGAFESMTPGQVPAFYQSIIDGNSRARPCSSYQDVTFTL